jgi:hypothetical protein
VNDVNRPHIPTINQLTGYIVITDDSLNEIQRLHLISHGDIVAGPETVDLDVHDLIYFSEQHYIVMSYYPKKPRNIPDSLKPHPDVKVVAVIIQEVKSGEVVNQWDSTQFPELYAASRSCNDFADKDTVQDYLHMNSMKLDPRDSMLICSCRNTNQILKIDLRKNKIVWRLGGLNSDFPVAPGQAFFRQHQASLIENNEILLVFDNGSKADRPQSRIIELKIDDAARKILSFNSYNIPEPFSRYMGSVQKTGVNYFIGGGTANYVLEIDPVSQERKIELLSGQTTYRAYKYPVRRKVGSKRESPQ